MKEAPRTKARAYHHGDLKEALISASLDLVREKGARGFSMNEAARRAGVSVAAPYRHFRDKDALLAAIVVDGNALLEASLRDAVRKTRQRSQRFLEAAVAYVLFARQHGHYFEVMFHSGIDKTQFPEVQESARKAFGVAYQAALESFSLPEAKTMKLALAAWTMTHGIAVLGAEGALAVMAGDVSDDKRARQLLQVLLASSTGPEAKSRSELEVHASNFPSATIKRRVRGKT